MSFGERLATAIDERGRLCVGIDPHAYLLHEWGLTDDAAGVRAFGLRVVEAAAGRIAIVKPQVAFFERLGSAGFAALEDVLAAARERGLITIADVKRGDVGSSVEAYGEAWLRPGSPLEVDAMTVSAYQGVGSLAAPFALAERVRKGLFVLAATSNPEAAVVQTASIAAGPRSGATVAAGIVADVTEWNRMAEAGPVGSVGVVLGATVDFSDYGIDLSLLATSPATPVLAPGFGYQGARIDQMRSLYGAASRNTIVSASRSILSGGPGSLEAAISALANEVHAAEVGAWNE